jgi:hypothetical protein
MYRTYIVPNCRLEELWTSPYKDKDVNAIRRIQDTFGCCRFNTVIDRAWSFPHGRLDESNGADQYEKIYRQDRPYVGP